MHILLSEHLNLSLYCFAVIIVLVLCVSYLCRTLTMVYTLKLNSLFVKFMPDQLFRKVPNYFPRVTHLYGNELYIGFPLAHLLTYVWNNTLFVFNKYQFSSVQFSCSVVSDSLQLHESQHTRPPCPSPTPGIYPNSCPSSRWCHPASSSSVIPFSSSPQSLPASESFQMSQLFAWGGQSIGVSASASVLPRNTQDWSPLRWTGWISLQSKGLARVFSNTTVQKHQFFGAQLCSQSNSHIHTWPQEKP